jgi:hypothetical protein
MKLTRADVFRGLLLARKIPKAQVRAMLDELPTTTDAQVLIKEMAIIDFEDSLYFYRDNALLIAIANSLEITSEQLDNFFKTNDYKALGVK